MSKKKLSTCGRFESTGVPYLLKSTATGTYFVRCRAGKKIVRRSLDTSNFVEARRLVPATVAEIKAGVAEVLIDETPRQLPPIGADWATAAECQEPDEVLDMLPTKPSVNAYCDFGSATHIFLRRLKNDPTTSERTKDYYCLVARLLLQNWKGLEEMTLQDLNKDTMLQWAHGFSKSYSNSYYNSALRIFRRVGEVMQEKDAVHGAKKIGENPASHLKTLTPAKKQVNLPSTDQLKRLLSYMDEMCPEAAVNSRVLIYTGMRRSEAEKLRWKDVNFEKNFVRVSQAKVRKTSSKPLFRDVPLIPDAQRYFMRLLGIRKPSPHSVILREGMKRVGVELENACKALKIDHLTLHDFRHLFATRCIESGVDIPTVSRWLGHQDGGALAMKTYGHLRQEHSFRQARRVLFGTDIDHEQVAAL